MTKDDPSSRWAVTANVMREVPFGPLGMQRRSGVKHFSGGAKVVVVDDFPGMCENVVVVGRHRGSHRHIKLALPVEVLDQFRAKVIYSPTVLRLIAEHYHLQRPRPLDHAGAEDLAGKYWLWKEELRMRPFKQLVRVQEHRTNGLTYLVAVDDPKVWNCEVLTSSIPAELFALGTSFFLCRDESEEVSYVNQPPSST